MNSAIAATAIKNTLQEILVRLLCKEVSAHAKIQITFCLFATCLNVYKLVNQVKIAIYGNSVLLKALQRGFAKKIFHLKFLQLSFLWPYP